MAWWRGDDKSHQNGKLLAVGLVGTGLYWRSVSWCASEESDGRVPAGVMSSLSPELGPKARKALLAKMVKERLYEPMPDLNGEPIAYLIPDYLTYNPSHAQLEARRKEQKERQAAKRAGR